MDDLEKCKEELEKLKDEIINLSFEKNYNKELELLEFIRDLYSSLNDEYTLEKLTKESLVENLKKYIRKFAKDNKLRL